MSISFWIGNLVWTKRSKVKFRCILNGMCLDISKCSKASTMDTKSFQGDPLSRLCHILVVFRQWMAQQVGRRLGAKKGKTVFVPILFSSLCRRRISWSCCHVFPGSRYPCPFFDRGNNHELPWKNIAEPWSSFLSNQNIEYLHFLSTNWNLRVFQRLLSLEIEKSETQIQIYQPTRLQNRSPSHRFSRDVCL